VAPGGSELLYRGEDGDSVVWVSERIRRDALGDPPAAMFTAPRDYTERSPQEVERLYTERLGRGYMGEKAVERLEQRYWKRRPDTQ
jgi:hypothetical protein